MTKDEHNALTVILNQHDFEGLNPGWQQLIYLAMQKAYLKGKEEGAKQQRRLNASAERHNGAY